MLRRTVTEQRRCELLNAWAETGPGYSPPEPFFSSR